MRGVAPRLHRCRVRSINFREPMIIGCNSILVANCSGHVQLYKRWPWGSLVTLLVILE